MALRMVPLVVTVFFHDAALPGVVDTNTVVPESAKHNDADLQ